MFRHVSFLRGYADNIEEILDEWKAYKIAVPTYGAIILNEDVSQVGFFKLCFNTGVENFSFDFSGSFGSRLLVQEFLGFPQRQSERGRAA